MGLEDEIDVPIKTIAALVGAAIRSEVGHDVLTRVVSDERTLLDLAADDLPALCVYRASETLRLQDSATFVHDVLVVFEYALPSSSHKEREKRRPLLARVWRAVREAIVSGKHDAVSGGADVFASAALQIQADNFKSVSVKYLMANGGREDVLVEAKRNPIFVGQALVTWTPTEVDAATLDDFLLMHAAYDEFPNPDPAPAQDDPETTTDDVEIPQD